MSLPPGHEAAVLDATSPSLTERTEAKALILEMLAGGKHLRTATLLDEVRKRCMREIAAPEPKEHLNLPRNSDPTSVVRRDVPIIAYPRLYQAAREALAELVANGVVLPTDSADQISIQITSDGSSWSLNLPIPTPDVPPNACMLAHAYQATESMLLDAAIYTADLERVLGTRGQRCLEEALTAWRRGLYLAAVNMLGAASEAAWYRVAERLAPTTEKIRTELNNRPRIGVLVGITVERMRQLGARKDIDELQVHAIYLRDLRNYGVHPQGAEARDLEAHFTEAAVGLLFLESHRYFTRLAAASGTIDQ